MIYLFKTVYNSRLFIIQDLYACTIYVLSLVHHYTSMYSLKLLRLAGVEMYSAYGFVKSRMKTFSLMKETRHLKMQLVTQVLVSSLSIYYLYYLVVLKYLVVMVVALK